MSDETAVRRLDAWSRFVVVGLNLCPFAGRAVAENRIRYVISREEDPAKAMQEVFNEAERVRNTAPDVLSTTIVALLGCLHEFEEFYQFAESLEKVFENDPRFADSVMPAWFHPQTQWEGQAFDDPVNYDKRAPFPVINLLRTGDVDAVVNAGLTADILDRNMERLALEGTERLKQLYTDIDMIE